MKITRTSFISEVTKKVELPRRYYSLVIRNQPLTFNHFVFIFFLFFYSTAFASPLYKPKAKLRDFGFKRSYINGRFCVNNPLNHSLKFTNADRRQQLFNVNKAGDRYLFTIADSLLGREMLVVTRLLQTPPNLSIPREQYGGEQENEQVWKWEIHGKQLLIRVANYDSRADSGTNMATALSNSALTTILFAFEITNRNIANHTSTIDVADFYNGDISAIGISDTIRKRYKISSLDASRSYIDTIRSFPYNIEVSTVKTYKAAESPTDKSNASITFELHTSMLLLPKSLMTSRLFDARVSYISQDHLDFGNGEYPAKMISFIHRWRLEPKDTAAYKRGELVEPTKQIVFYVDPATPKKWVPYFIKGVNDWQKAFEAAGFKNAIIGKPAPGIEEDPEFSTEDARYNVIRYFASDQKNAYGPIVTDPRSGEIIESHVGWYHNQIKELHDWYFIQTAAANPKARKMEYTTAEMGELIRYTIAHEIGHTLGLPHNWGASSAYPVDSLRSKTFTNQHGTAASIMDYARFNYIAQPEDNVTQFNPQIGEYDLWAIKWGYTWFPGHRSPEAEKKLLDKWTAEKSGNQLFYFGREMTFYDPRSQNEDIGDNAITAGQYGIANLKKILPNLAKWTYQPGNDESNLLDFYKQVIEQYWRYGSHVITLVGGVYFNYKTYDDHIKGYEFVDKLSQQKAIQFLIREFYTTPKWLINKQELSEIDNALILNKIQAVQLVNLSKVLDPARLARILDNQLKQGQQAYAISDLFKDLRNGIFIATPDAYQRVLQREYIGIFEKLIHESSPLQYIPYADDDRQGYPAINISMTDIKPLVISELIYINQHLPKDGNDELLRAHWADLHMRINAIVNQKDSN